MVTFAERLKTLRKEKGVTLENIASVLGTSKVTISRYENGIREPKSDVLKLLADYFDVSLDYLMGVSDARNPQLKTESKKLKPEVETIAAHLDDKDITPKKLRMIQDYIDLLFDDEE